MHFALVPPSFDLSVKTVAQAGLELVLPAWWGGFLLDLRGHDIHLPLGSSEQPSWTLGSWDPGTVSAVLAQPGTAALCIVSQARHLLSLKCLFKLERSASSFFLKKVPGALKLELR